jgi:uncharacterized protein YegL
MKKDYTDIICLLDRSGSMASLKNDMVNGLKTFVAEQKKLPGECLFTLVQFDSTEYKTVYDARPIDKVEDIDLIPGGATPLLDSLGRLIEDTGKRFKIMREDERPQHIVFMIITDGEENASMRFSRHQIREMIKVQSETYNWHFTYLGANQDAFQEAHSIGIPRESTITFQANLMGTQSMYNSASNATSMLRSGIVGTMAYNKSDYDAQEDAKQPK